MLAQVLLPLLAIAAPDDPPHDYFTNSWALVGLEDYPSATRISPENELVLPGGRRFELEVGREALKTLLEGWLPIVQIETEEAGIGYRILIWATPRISVSDWERAFAGPSEGEDFATWVVIRSEESGTQSLYIDSAEDPIRAVDASELDWRLWLERTASYWVKRLDGATRLTLPDHRAADCLRASHVYQLIGNDRGEIHAGEGFYDEFYIRDAAYQVMQFEEWGFAAAARRGMESFLECQREDGRFESQNGQLDANGQALWALWQYYLITRDREWLARAYPAMARGAHWTLKAISATKDAGRFAGLLPAAPADGEYLWGGEHHIVGYDLWNLRGLQCTAAAAAALHNSAEHEQLRLAAHMYRRCIGATLKQSASATFPPSWEGVGTHWGNTEVLWPTPLYPPFDPRVSASLAELREDFGGGFCEGTLRWCPERMQVIHPYLTAYTTLASLIRGEHELVAEEFYATLFHTTATHGCPEGVHFRRRFAWGGTVPHLLGAANYAILLRHMLVHEQDGELHLLKGVPDWWLAPGEEIRLENAPTHFGPLSLRVVGQDAGLHVSVELPTRNPPARTILHHPSTRVPFATPSGVELHPRAPQRTTWNLEHTLDLYGREIVAKEIPGLLAGPPDPPPPADACHLLDLRAVANVNPFRAPFGVLEPGNYLFNELETGLRTIAGIPFHLLDPQYNDGRAMVVLHGDGGAATFPREVEIPVNLKGARLFLLGAVHGYMPQDDGRGPFGALAEVIIRYTGGEEQVVPLVAGRTCDDWALAPSAKELHCAESSDPWHLNLLSVALRPMTVESLLFRDLGTPAAPLLAAATLETVETPRNGLRLDLSGPWRVRLDPDRLGLTERWYATALPPEPTIDLPSTTDRAGLGPATDPASAAPGHLARAHAHLGPAWYQRTLTIPPHLAGKHLELTLERVLWKSELWIGDRHLGSQDSLVAPHRYELGQLPPGPHRLTLCIDNSMQVNLGTMGHAYGPETQSRWNGAVGRLEITAREAIHIQDAQVFPDLDHQRVRVALTLANRTARQAEGTLYCQVDYDDPTDDLRIFGNALSTLTITPGETRHEITVALEHTPSTWDEFSPELYVADLRLFARVGSREYSDDTRVTFGFRHLERDGRTLLLNSRPLSLRGTVNCCVFPATGHPPTDRHSWTRIFEQLQLFGLNHVRFHSWCPPRAAFEAADRLGIYLQPETPLWIDGWMEERSPTHPVLFGKDPAVAHFIEREFERILAEYGNHPSLCMLMLGNELPAGSDYERMEQLLARARSADPRHLYAATCARALLPSDDFHVTHRAPAAPARGVGPAHTDWDFAKAVDSVPVPLIAHEIGQRPSFPDYARLDQYERGPLRPYNLLPLREKLVDSGMLAQNKDFQRSSVRFAELQYKAEIEAVLRTPGYAGFQLLSLEDFSGQGEALVGLLDPFYTPKAGASAERFRRFCAPTVPLLRFEKTVWQNGETFFARIEMAHFGPADIEAASLRWRVVEADGTEVAQGIQPPRHLPTGRVSPMGSFGICLEEDRPARELRIELDLDDHPAANDWTIWVYPRRPLPLETGAVNIHTNWEDAKFHLDAFRHSKVLLLAHGTENDRAQRDDFLSVYWSAAFFPNTPGTLGLLCDPAHPALAGFPTARHADWQWRSLSQGATAFRSRAIEPIVQPISDFHRAHRLATLFETQVGFSSLMVCGYDLQSDLENRPAAREFLASLLAYMNSRAFAPTQQLDHRLLDHLLQGHAEVERRAPDEAELARATLDVQAAEALGQSNRNIPWRRELDQVRVASPGHSWRVSSGGTWKDSIGAAWHGNPLVIELELPRGRTGELYVHVHDWNHLGRSGRIELEGITYKLGAHAGEGAWLGFTITPDNIADGELALSLHPSSGPNLMVTRVVFVPDGPERLDALLPPLLEKYNVPALGAAIVDTSGLLAIGAAGQRSLDSEERVTSEDLWHLGSCTKAMTGVLLARLIERGHLSWATTVGNVFFKRIEDLHPAWIPVTLEQLLSHRAGAPGGLRPEWMERMRRREGTPTEQRRVFVADVLTRPPVHEPGSRYLYSNAGYVIAGRIAEELTGQAWEELMRTELFEPLGMKSAGFGAPGTPDAIDQPLGHSGNRPIPPDPLADNPPAIGPAGTVHASLADWGRFLTALLAGLKQPSPYLEPASIERLFQPVGDGNYALGWIVTERTWAKGRALTHSGSNTVWYCTVWMAPDLGFAVLATTNSGVSTAPRACDAVAAALIAHIHKK